jgi:hypothetical protein
MSEFPVSQLIIIAIMAVLLILVVPVIESRTGKSLTEILFGVRRKKSKNGSDGASVPAKEPRINNGTKGELMSFLSKLIRFAGKNGMQTVTPAIFSYKGKTSRLAALLVTPGGVIGVFCQGYGGTITGALEPAAWKQHINGEDRTFENPLKVCREQQNLMQEAMQAAGIEGTVDVVAVFTNARATLREIPSSRIYSQDAFMDHLRSTSALRNGSLDVEKTAKALAEMVDIKGKKESKNKKRK